MSDAFGLKAGGSQLPIGLLSSTSSSTGRSSDCLDVDVLPLALSENTDGSDDELLEPADSMARPRRYRMSRVCAGCGSLGICSVIGAGVGMRRSTTSREKRKQYGRKSVDCCRFHVVTASSLRAADVTAAVREPLRWCASEEVVGGRTAASRSAPARLGLWLFERRLLFEGPIMLRSRPPPVHLLGESSISSSVEAPDIADCGLLLSTSSSPVSGVKSGEQSCSRNSERLNEAFEADVSNAESKGEGLSARMMTKRRDGADSAGTVLGCKKSFSMAFCWR